MFVKPRRKVRVAMPDCEGSEYQGHRYMKAVAVPKRFDMGIGGLETQLSIYGH